MLFENQKSIDRRKNIMSDRKKQRINWQSTLFNGCSEKLSGTNIDRHILPMKSIPT